MTCGYQADSRHFLLVDVPETRYARSGDVSIAYQVVGEGPIDLVWVQGFVSNVELGWQMPTLASFNRQLAKFCRLIRFATSATNRLDGMFDFTELAERAKSQRARLEEHRLTAAKAALS